MACFPDTHKSGILTGTFFFRLLVNSVQATFSVNSSFALFKKAIFMNISSRGQGQVWLVIPCWQMVLLQQGSRFLYLSHNKLYRV